MRIYLHSFIITRLYGSKNEKMTKIFKIRPYLIKKVHNKNTTDVTTFKHVEVCNII